MNSKFKQQCWGFLIKKFHTSRRDKKFLCTGLFTPLSSVIILVFIWLIAHAFVQNVAFLIFPQEFIDISNLWDAVRISYVVEKPEQQSIIGQRNDFSKTGLLSLINNQWPENDDWPEFSEFSNLSDMNSYLLYNFSAPLFLGGMKFENIEENQFDIGILYNTSEKNMAGMLVNMMSEAIYKKISNQTTFQLYEYRQDLPTSNYLTDISFVYYGPLILTYGFVFIIPFFSILIIQEKEKGLKDLLLLNSLNRKDYWLFTFISDFILYLIPMCFSVFLIYLFSVLPITDNNFLGPLLLFVGLAVYTLAAAYLISFLFDKEETANKFVYSITSLLTLVTSIISGIIGGPQDFAANYITAICWGPYAFFKGLYNMSYHQINEGSLDFFDTFSFQKGLFPYILILWLDGILILFIAVQLDLKLQKLSPGDPCSCNSKNLLEEVSEKFNTEEDVKKEEIRTLNPNCDDLVKICGIKKIYKEENSELNYAVKGVTFGIPSGQCFGLLGPNGAGKTTLISILSGLLRPEEGTATIQGHDILNDINGAYQYLGVCQQFDVLWDLMTVEEHLYLYSRIKNIPSDEIPQQVNKFISEFGLSDHRHKLIKELSGGNKRKLSVAISLLGNPKIVFLDEPSSGMDPVTRRAMWKIIERMKEGRATILTTHSMEEADALCGRIGIMVKGQLQCIGSSQHLKSKFGKGFQLSLTTSFENSQDLIEFVKDISPNIILEENLGETFHFEVPQNEISLSKLFKIIEDNKEKYDIIDYSISQTTLEQIFLKFAFNQEK